MPTPSVIPVDVLLTPIPGENPAGKDVRYTWHDVFKEARRQDEDLPQGDWKPKGPPKMADWGKVVEIGSKVLQEESKDLQIAAWLLEALVKLHGFGGLRDGLRLIRELHIRFWDTMFPIIEEEDLEFRAAPIEWLNEKDKSPFFPLTIQQIPILHSSDGVRYSFFHLKESRAVENLGKQNPKAKTDAVAEGKVPKEQFDKAETGTPLAHCLALLDDVRACEKEVMALDQILKEKYGESNPDRPSFRNIQEVIESCRLYLEETVQKKGGAGMSQPGNSQALESPVPSTSGDGKAMVSGQPGSIEPVDRLDALRRLHAVAEFFQRTEPHSPIPLLVNRAMKWGEMPLEEWLNEVIKSKDVLGAVRETLGLKEEKPK